MPVIGRYKLNRLHLAARNNRRQLGDIYREKFGALDLVMLFKPEDIETVFRNEGAYPSRGEIDSLKTYRNSRKHWYSTTGLLVLQGKEWWDLRSQTQRHLLKPKAIQAYLNPMQDIAREFVDKMAVDRDARSEIPDYLGELYKWALESVAFVGLDTRLGCFESAQTYDSESSKMIRSVSVQFESMNNLESITGNIPFWKLFPTPAWKKFEKESDIFSEIAFKYINRSLEDLRKISINDDKELTLLQSMLMTKGLEVGGAMVTVADMLMAGIDTTAHTVGFFLYNIARNPDKQEVLFQEVAQLKPQKGHRMAQNVLNDLKYLKACMKESQRMIPTLGGMSRLLENELVLSGYRVPAGVIVAANLFEIGLDKQYFSQPDKFLPERWLSKDEKTHPFAFLPFGFGTRSCIGRRLAELEIICLLSEIIRNFKVEYHYEDIGIHTRLINAPDSPLRFTFIER